MRKAGFAISMFLLVVLSAWFSGCRNRTEPSASDLTGIQIEPVRIHDYGAALSRLDPDRLGTDLDQLYPEFAFFLGENYRDTLNLIRLHDFLSDPLIQRLEDRYSKVYGDPEPLNRSLTQAFRRMKYHFPDGRIPEVYTYLSGLYYEYPVQDYDSILVLALDLYLGSGEETYRAISMPQYKVSRMTPGHVLPDAFRELGKRYAGAAASGKTLLDQMIWQGKLLYFLDLTLPDTPDSLKIGYSTEKLAWCHKNETNTWAFLIERDLLYSTDSQVIGKMMQDGPFTSGLPLESPARLGWWTGWQIVKAYARQHPDQPSSEVFQVTDGQKFLAGSGYKPKR